jgi:outer membrane cobalamin receptor
MDMAQTISVRSPHRVCHQQGSVASRAPVWIRCRHTARTMVGTVMLLLVFVSSTYAQVERGELRLSVTDATGLPVSVTGTLASEAPRLFRAFSTDQTGRFVLQDVPFGVYRLIVERNGFTPYSTVIEVRTAVPRELSIALTLAPVSADVTVSDDRPLVDAARAGVTFSISAPQLQEALPSVPGRRVLDLVDAQPGWLMEANGVLHPRGSEYQTLFVIDGIPMDENRSPAFAPDLEDAEVQGVTVLTGNFPAEYGRKLGGVVEVTTVRDIDRGLHAVLDAGGGSFGTASAGAALRYGWRTRALSISASGARTDRYLDPPVAENFTNHGSLGGVSAAYDDQLSDADRVRVTWHRRSTDFLVPNERVQEAAGQRQERRGGEDLLQGMWTGLLGSRAVLNIRGVGEQITATLASNTESTPIVADQDRTLRRGLVNASLAFDLGRHQLKAGGDWLVAPVRESLQYQISDPSAFARRTQLTFAFAGEQRDREQSLFAQDTVRAGALTVSAGLRWDHYAFVVRDSAFSPRLGVAWATAGGNLVLRASYDRAFQTPAVENLLLASSPEATTVASSSARAPVQPSRGNFVEAGATAGIARRIRLDTTAYRRSFENFADDDVFLNTGVSIPIAFSSALVRGVDTKMTVLPIGRVSGFLSYSLMKGIAQLPLTGGLFLGTDAVAQLAADGEVPITQDQRHTLRAQLHVAANSRLWLATTVRYGSGLPIELDADADPIALAAEFGADTLAAVDIDAGRVRANLAVDVGAGFTMWQNARRRVTLRGEVTNIANRVNVINFAGLFSGTALGAPRSASVRLQAEF